MRVTTFGENFLPQNVPACYTRLGPYLCWVDVRMLYCTVRTSDVGRGGARLKGDCSINSITGASLYLELVYCLYSSVLVGLRLPSALQ